MGPGGEEGGFYTHSYDVPPRGPLPQHLLHGREAQPLAPAALDDEGLEQRAREEQGRQEQGAGGLDEAEGPVAEGVQRLRGVMAADQDEHGERAQRGDGAGEADGGDARADDRGGVAAEGRRRARLGREVEGDDVEEGVEDLGLRSVCVSRGRQRPGLWWRAATRGVSETYKKQDGRRGGDGRWCLGWKGGRVSDTRP